MSVGPWWWICALLGVCGLVAWVGHRAGQRRKVPTLPEQWDLDARPVLNADERQALRHLREALPHNTVFAKLPLVRLCQPRDAARQQYWFEMLGNLHVSFAICSANARVLAVIDLEPARGMSARALRIKQSVLNACRIRYVHCKPSMLPAPSDLELLLRPQGQTTLRLAPLAVAPARAAAASQPLQHARSQLTDTVRSRRAARPLPPDSMFAQDSFFAPSSQLEAAANSDFPPSVLEGAEEAPSARR